MTEPAGAVFLSYASQDAAAARHIADALRAASPHNLGRWIPRPSARQVEQTPRPRVTVS